MIMDIMHWPRNWKRFLRNEKKGESGMSKERPDHTTEHESENLGPSGKASCSNELGKAYSIVFEIIIIAAVLVCLVGMIYCCLSFSQTSIAFNAEWETALRSISSIAASADASGLTLDQKQLIDGLLTHMETMVTIQKSGMTNDLMSFIYGILSAVLVGLCATFVAKSRTNADEAKKTADEAKSSAEAAKKQAEIAENKAKQTKNAIMQAQSSAEAAKKQAEIAENKAKQTKNAIIQARKASDATKKLGWQVKLVIVSSRIASAKASLLAMDNISANKEITKIRDEISSLFSNDEFLMIIQSDDHDSMEVSKAYNELLDLQENVDAFEKECRMKYSEEALQSKKSAAKNYHNWIQIAIDCIDASIRAMKKPTRKR